MNLFGDVYVKEVWFKSPVQICFYSFVNFVQKAAFRGKGFGTLRRVDKRTAAKVVETVDIKSGFIVIHK